MSPLSSQFDPRMPTCLTIVLSRGTRLPRGIAIQDERRAPARHRMRISSHSNEACFDVVFRALAEVGPTRLALADNPYTWEPPGAWVVLFAAQSRSEVGRNLPGGKNLNVVMWTYVGGLGFIKDHPGVRCDRGPHVPSTINPPVHPPRRGRTDPRERKATSSKPSLSPVFGNPHHSHFFSNGPSFSLQTD